MRYFVQCKYKGTNYHGWQRQPDTPKTIQQELEDALTLVTREEISITGCGRTDTGVHAALYYFHFDTEFQDVDKLIYKVNQITSHDIHCVSIDKVANDAHARFDASKRGYIYVMSKEVDPFRLETAYVHLKKSDINFKEMNEAAKAILGEHSFEAFCKAHTDVKTKVCTILESRWVETETDYHYYIKADRFLRGMVRLIVGMCINVGRDRLSIEEVQEALAEKKRLSLDWSVPSKGLYLDLVEYPYL